MLEKSLESAADCLYLDLEDSVPPSEKDNARRATKAVLGRVTDKLACVRINDLTTGLTLSDLEAVVQPNLAAVVVPKVEGGDTLRVIDQFLFELEKRNGVSAGIVRIIASLETAAGIANCAEIVRASKRLGAVLCGTAEDGDLQRDLGYVATESKTEVVYALSHVLVQARAAGIPEILAGPYVKFADDAGLEHDAAFARQIGCTGKAAIHPRQIDIINKVFTPSADELAYYERVVIAMRDAHERGLGAVTVDGRMVDQAMVERARSVIGADLSSEQTTKVNVDAPRHAGVTKP
jgi:citrate lyase subunit beta / citryl-CoA lyase